MSSDTIEMKMRYSHPTAGGRASDFTFNFNLASTSKTTNGYDIEEAVSSWLEHVPEDGWPNWVVSNEKKTKQA